MTNALRGAELVGAELAVSQHLEDLLLSGRGQDLLHDVAGFSSGDDVASVRAVRALAAWLADELINGGRSHV
jgi:hypothetical protein